MSRPSSDGETWGQAGAYSHSHAKIALLEAVGRRLNEGTAEPYAHLGKGDKHRPRHAIRRDGPQPGAVWQARSSAGGAISRRLQLFSAFEASAQLRPFSPEIPALALGADPRPFAMTFRDGRRQGSAMPTECWFFQAFSVAYPTYGSCLGSLSEQLGA